MLHTQSGELAARMREIEADAHTEAGAPFNLESPKQLQQILFERLRTAGAAQDPDRHALHRPRTCSRNSRPIIRCRS